MSSLRTGARLLEEHSKFGIDSSQRIDSSYKLIEFLSGRRNSADTVVNVATVELFCYVYVVMLLV